jgi:acetyl/propionyl-CoA carboxylase alpha subunit
MPCFLPETFLWSPTFVAPLSLHFFVRFFFVRPHMSAISLNPESLWQQQFRFDDVKCLIVCRGPIRLEAMGIFQELGATYGILLSEKDSIIYPQTLAPELRFLPDRHAQVHHISDYTGTTKEERQRCIDQILHTCHTHHYTHLFAGYGFMAEDADFIAQVERAGICFVGPSSRVIRQAGSKDEAKRLARRLSVSVTPGEDRITARTLLRQAGTQSPQAFLEALISTHQLEVPADWSQQEDALEMAETVLQASYAKHIDLFSIAELQQETERCCAELWSENPGRRIRFKHISGGGGKGQRVVQQPEEVAEAVKAVLLEARANGVGDNKTFLIEMNIENTRHNEVQLVGNGQWCVELGGRDCSLQMHEQKLVELSLTEELLEGAIAEYEAAGRPQTAAVLRSDLQVLKNMCKQAEDFGTALRLNNVSTFECIIEDDRHFFMEVNTRIQVEHRVTEMAYRLEFANPDDPTDTFLADSLVAVMLLIACHGDRLPRPQRRLRHRSGMEVRINATNAALQPHAGGVLRAWSPPIEDELRDDQGIGLRNPDTGLFQPYHLAGAYDSNVALSVTYADSRYANLEKMAQVLREMEVRGADLQLNTSFHYGLLYWMMGVDAMVKPNTRFVQSYLALCGKLRRSAQDVDIEYAWQAQMPATALGTAARQAYEQKQTLLLRPLRKLMEQPHLLAGWLARRPQQRWEIVENSRLIWRQNPVIVLRELYRFLHWEKRPGLPPSEIIWEDDHQLLDRALNFYTELESRLGESDWPALDAKVQGACPAGFEAELWSQIQAAHRGFQIGVADLLRLPIALGVESGYFAFTCDEQLNPQFPEEFADAANTKEYTQALAPPPMATSDQVLSWTGGTFYAKETPTSPPYVEVGQHVDTGDVLGLLEVMKMFNPIRAEFPGIVRQVAIDGASGQIVSRGQLLFVIEPDVPPKTETEAEITQRQRMNTQRLLAWSIA